MSYLPRFGVVLAKVWFPLFFKERTLPLSIEKNPNKVVLVRCALFVMCLDVVDGLVISTCYRFPMIIKSIKVAAAYLLAGRCHPNGTRLALLQRAFVVQLPLSLDVVVIRRLARRSNFIVEPEKEWRYYNNYLYFIRPWRKLNLFRVRHFAERQFVSRLEGESHIEHAVLVHDIQFKCKTFLSA